MTNSQQYREDTFSQKISKTWRLFRGLIKKQFFGRNKFFFFILPLGISWTVVFFHIYPPSLFDYNNISSLLTIISLIGGILLNFLALIASSKESILQTRGKKIYGSYNGYGVDDDFQVKRVEVNHSEFIYGKIFFLIFLSLAFLFGYIFFQIGIVGAFLKFLIWLFEKINMLIILPIGKDWLLNWIFRFPYVTFLSFYFLNFFFLLIKLYPLLKEDSYAIQKTK